MAVQATQPVYLTDFSAKDKPWDLHRGEADGFRDLYRGTTYDCYAARIAECSGYLGFAFEVGEVGECTLKLRAARFCRVRHCPVCQWRRALMWRAKFFQALPGILNDYPRARFIFLTLTVRNCELSELRSQLHWMNKSWEKLTKRKEWPAIGWVKSVEVTRAADDLAHPHFHALLMVKPSYFSHGYVSQQDWTELWKSCSKIDYTPVVDVRSIRPRRGTPEAQIPSEMISAIAETLKYSVKPSDVLREHGHSKLGDRDWLLELTSQLHKTRAVATSGILRGYLAEMLEEEPADLIHAEELSEVVSETDSPRVYFGWRERVSRYAMTDA